MSLEEILIELNIPCLADVDTRSIVKKLRESGTMRGVITQDISNMNRCLNVIKNFKHDRLVESVSVEHSCLFGSENTGPNIALLDCGTKYNISKSLVGRGCRVTQFPCLTDAKDIINGGFDGLMLSNGPGDPADCTQIIRNVKELMTTECLPCNLPWPSVNRSCRRRLDNQNEIRAQGAQTIQLNF
jgi:carbamoyl-phosphate synthase small subunit